MWMYVRLGYEQQAEEQERRKRRAERFGLAPKDEIAEKKQRVD